MQVYATLILINIENLYSMDKEIGHDGILPHAFLAIHHDRILKIGTGHYHKFIDKDTRIIDATGMIVVPGFIDCNCSLYPTLPAYVDQTIDVLEKITKYDSEANMVRGLEEICYRMLKHGVTTIGYEDTCLSKKYIGLLSKNYRYELIHHKIDQQKCCCPSNIMTRQRSMKGMFISCAYHPVHSPYLDLLALSKFATMLHHYDAYELLEAMTITPSLQLNAVNVGVLKAGYQADIVLLRGYDIKKVFVNDLYDSIAGVIKRGVHIFPKLII